MDDLVILVERLLKRRGTGRVRRAPTGYSCTRQHIGNCLLPGRASSFWAIASAGRRYIRAKSLSKFKDRIRQATRRRAASVERIISTSTMLCGWLAYFKHAYHGIFPARRFIRRRLRDSA
ncbi:MAG: group II intron maturase-specific domain-containing protein [Lysobacterales bacterium]